MPPRPRRNPKFGPQNPPRRAPRPSSAGKPPARSTGSAPRSPKPPPSSPSPDRETHWDAVSEWYDTLVGADGSEYHRRVVIPGVLGLLEVEPGRRILDVACGQGVLCRAMAKRGADVVGVDAAPGLIEAARLHAEREPLPIEYHVADAKHLEEFVDTAGLYGQVDAVTCTLAIQNIAVLSPVWRGCRGALREGGVLVVVMMHPCFRVPKASGWGWQPPQPGPARMDAADPAARDGLQYRRVDAYLSSRKTRIQMHPGTDPDLATLTFHRPLQAYINTLAEAGLLIDRVEEWPSHKQSDRTDPRAPAQDRARQEIPMFLALRARAVRLGGESGSDVQSAASTRSPSSLVE